MLQEFEDWANWYGVLDCVKDELFPPLISELLEDYRCQLSRRDLRAISSNKNRKALVAALDQLDKDSRIEDVAGWLRHRDRNDAVVILEAIEDAIREVDKLEDERRVPLHGMAVVRFCLSDLYD